MSLILIEPFSNAFVKLIVVKDVQLTNAFASIVMLLPLIVIEVKDVQLSNAFAWIVTVSYTHLTLPTIA